MYILETAKTNLGTFKWENNFYDLGTGVFNLHDFHWFSDSSSDIDLVF